MPAEPESASYPLGVLREAVSALMNLVRLLGSSRIGPRELRAVLTELEESSRGWLEGAREGRAPERVREFFELLAESARATPKAPLRAKQRLDAERTYRTLAEKGSELLSMFEREPTDFS